MQVIASTKEIRISPRKVRLVADQIRNLSIDEALDALSIIEKRGAYGLNKTLKAAVANATNNANLSRNDLVIKSIDINEGASIKRFHPSTRGRVHPYKKRSTTIKVTLEDKAPLVDSEIVFKPTVKKEIEEKIENKEASK